MKEKQNRIDRRNFLKTMGTAGVGAAFAGMTDVFASAQAAAGPNEPNVPEKPQEPKFPQVPRRKLGKTGVEVPCLSIGTNHLDNQIILRNTLKWGVSYWDTASTYGGGNSELEIGKFLLKNPQVREKLFIVSKAHTKPIANMDKRLQTSLERMNTKYIDLYDFHGVSDPAQLTDELKQWANSAKKRKLIRFFGFSTHKNMAALLQAAAKLGWIDVIMTAYNFRLMQDAKMQQAVEACHKAGIGLVAMKVMGHGQKMAWKKRMTKIETEGDKKVAGHFLQKGFTEGQAKIKVVLEDKRISSVCVGMNNVALLTSNVAAVLDKTKLSQTDMKVFKEYAAASCSGYCAGCAEICDSALPDMPYVSDIMRYLMYHNSYGEQDRARTLFAEIPGQVRERLASIDYRMVEARCPQHLPIGKLIAEAVSKLA